MACARGRMILSSRDQGQPEKWGGVEETLGVVAWPAAEKHILVSISIPHLIKDHPPISSLEGKPRATVTIVCCEHYEFERRL